ncbi:MAG: DNA mismatch repair endonuclease MutL, partial [Planctomycetales bacterium]|nr:DNA mismatch repair endonuclease MutL [Planctomycetales bacterium]
MPQINQLSATVVNQIAAGEVIERPASVVKELVENSLDAGARRVDVVIEKGGVDLIRVVDDGCGIEAEQLQLAVASHATSKIVSADDLFRVASLGFRGEALASIGAVSRLQIRSRPEAAEAAARIEVVGGREEPIEPAAGPRGTLIEVRQLFFNTPVRKKFLRTHQTEASHVTEAIVRLALAHPHVHFPLSHNTRQVHDLPPGGFFERITQLFGADLAGSLLPIDAVDEDVRLFGYVANPTHSRPHNRMQYLLLNGRFIRDRSLQHALGEAYRGLLLTGRFPICFLQLEIPPASVDVNVHPTKLEVRFQDGGRLYSHLLGSLRTRFLSTDLVARANLPVDGEDAEAGSGGGPSAELMRWAQRELAPAVDDDDRHSAWAPPAYEEPRNALGMHDVALGRVDPGDAASRGDIGFRERVEQGRPSDFRTASGDESGLPAGPPAMVRYDAPASLPALQIHNRYLVSETAEGLEVIDQHA